MALQKSDIQFGFLSPGYNTQSQNRGATPAVLDQMLARVSFQITDNIDGSLVGERIVKQVDIWPLLTSPQQSNLTTLIQNITNLAISHV